jgi:hypothetical protein
MKIRTHAFDIACEQDLLQLKRVAQAARSVFGDSEDIAFLEALPRTRSKEDQSPPVSSPQAFVGPLRGREGLRKELE